MLALTDPFEKPSSMRELFRIRSRREGRLREGFLVHGTQVQRLPKEAALGLVPASPVEIVLLSLAETSPKGSAPNAK